MLSTLRRKIGGVGYCPHGGGGGGSQTSTATTINYSPEEAAHRARVSAEAERVYQNSRDAVAGASYPGAVPTGPSGTTLAGWGSVLGAVPMMERLAGSAAGAVGRGTSQDVLYAHSNPYLQSYINAAIRPLEFQYTDPGGVMSSIRTDAGTIGGQGTNTRQGIAEGIAGGRFAQEAGDISSRIASEGYGQGLEHQARMAALAPAVQGMQTAPGQAITAVGQNQEQYEQAMNDYEANARIWDLEKTWGPLQNWANIVYGAGSSQATATGTSPGPRTNPAMGAIGGAAMGASLWPMIVSGGNPLVGAGLGLLAGLFGS